MTDLGSALAGLCSNFDMNLLKSLKNYLLILNKQSNAYSEDIAYFEGVFRL